MGLGPEAVIVLHIGGGSDDKPAAIERFQRGFEGLGEAARGRLVIENDDRLFGVGDACELAERIGRPVVFDALHHFCYDPDQIPAPEALRMCLRSWPRGVRAKIHYSSPRVDLEEVAQARGKPHRHPKPAKLSRHSDLIDPLAFTDFLIRSVSGARAADVMLESKGKDISLLRLVRQLQSRGASFKSGWLDWRELR